MAEKASGLLKARANPDRLSLPWELNQEALRAGMLSQQLTVLREGWLVVARREGAQIFLPYR